MMPEPLVLESTLGGMLVCVASDWTPEQMLAFAEESQPASFGGWRICEEGDPRLGGARQRTPCPDSGRAAVHVALRVA